MSDPRPDEFIEFIKALKDTAPEGYEPWLFRCEKGGKNPDLSYGSWKAESARLSVQEAVQWMRNGGNVGLAATADDPLINVDVDDDEETSLGDVKETLLVRSRSRTGFHAIYFEAEDSEEIPNIPTDDAGEVRARWQYVVAPGSYVPVEDVEELPEDERDMAGYYTLLEDRAPARIDYEELPDVFLDYNERGDDADVDTEEMPGGGIEDFEGEDGGYDDDSDRESESALFDITARDVVLSEHGSVNIGDRWEAMFHGSETGANMSFSSKGLINCWRHSVAHNGLQALAVLSDYDGSCQHVGTGHKHSNAGDSCLTSEDGGHIWHAWKYAKQNGYIPDDDPVPYSAMLHVARERDICPVSDIPKSTDDSLPAYAYDAVLETIEGHDGLETGRKKTDEFSDASSSDTQFDAVTARGSADEGDQERSETDGGAVTATVEESSKPRTRFERFRDEVHSAIDAVKDDDDLTQRTARHRMAEAFDRHYDFVFPEDEVRGWRTKLYVYAEGDGIYEPRGEAFVAKQLEKAACDYVTNQVVNEIVGKLERMATERGPAFEGAPERLAVGNGILDLHTGELDPFTPTEYHRKKLDVDWNPDAGEPDAIDAFLHDIVADDDVGTLYRLIAHSMYKEYVGEKAAMLIGSGQNGKSVFLDLVEQFLGQYNVSHRSLQAFEDKFAANALEGKLANIHPDMGDSDVTDLSQFKKLTGRDTFQADVKFESPVEFENYATLMFAANEMPVFDEDNHAVWRRWLYLDFPYTFDPDNPDAKDPEPKRVLMRRLTTDDQLEALLYRCQQEVERWYEGDSWYPDAMEPSEVREQMKKAAEPVFDFAMTCLIDVEDEDDDGVWLPKSDVRQAYREYAAEQQLPTMGKEQFGERLLGLADLNIESGRPTDENGNRPRAYMGVTWSERGRQLLGLDEPGDEDQSTVGDVSSTKGRVKEIVHELVTQNDNEPVERSLVVGRAMGAMGMATAEKRVDDLLKSGDLYEPEDGKVIDT